MLEDGHLVPFFTRPISLIIIAMIAFTVVSRFAWFKQATGAVKSGIKGLFVRA